MVACPTSVLISHLEGNTNMKRGMHTPSTKRLNRRPNKLTDSILRRAKPSETRYKLSDGGGLYCEINPTGSKLWRINYRFNGKQRTLYLPSYPEMSLLDARDALYETKRLLINGVDPMEAKREKKNAWKTEEQVKKAEEERAKRLKTTFRWGAEDWLADYVNRVTPKQVVKIKRHLELYLYPAFGDMPVADIRAVDILVPARARECEKKIHTAHRLIQLTGQVLDHAILLDFIQYNLARNGLSKKLMPEPTTHHAAVIDPREIGELLCDIDDYKSSTSLKYYLKIMPYVFTRNTELRAATWEEFDLYEEMMWTIPKKRLKIKDEDHKVPLARQVVELLLELKEVTADSKFLFPSPRAKTATLSDAGPLAALRRMGYDKDTMTIHGFRTIASTCLNELGYKYDHIERQLAHKEKDPIRGAYNRAGYIEQRRQLIQDWADILDGLRLEARERRKARMTKRKQRLQAEV